MGSWDPHRCSSRAYTGLSSCATGSGVCARSSRSNNAWQSPGNGCSVLSLAPYLQLIQGQALRAARSRSSPLTLPVSSLWLANLGLH